jgi:hypothetical protein
MSLLVLIACFLKILLPEKDQNWTAILTPAPAVPANILDEATPIINAYYNVHA